jgi:molybdopterin molybdotransferase
LRTARLTQALPANDARQDYLRARLSFRDGEWCAEPFDVQDSAMQRVFAAADGLIVREPHAVAATEGERVDILTLDDV